MRAPCIAFALALALVAGPSPAPAQAATPDEAASRDPRNWPTVSRLIGDRFERAGEVVTLRVHARRSEFYGCGYRHTAGRFMAFTLLGGPLETLTGYVPRDLGKVLERQLAEDPWLPITVQVRFDPDKVGELCQDQVDILKWSRGWQYPPGTLSPGRPDASMQPTSQALEAALDKDLWTVLTSRKLRRRQLREGARTEEELVGSTIELTAGARVDNAFFCAFRGATRTHFGLRLHDGAGRYVHAYLARSPQARRLMDTVALHRDVMLKLQARVVKQMPSNYCAPQLEITGWSFPDQDAR